MCIFEIIDKVEKLNRKRKMKEAHHFAVAFSAVVMVISAAAICLTSKTGKKMLRKMTDIAEETAEVVEKTVLAEADIVDDYVAEAEKTLNQK